MPRTTLAALLAVGALPALAQGPGQGPDPASDRAPDPAAVVDAYADVAEAA